MIRSDLGLGFARQAAGPALVADEEALPFAPGCFDLVVSAMDLHWVNDLPGTLIQIGRILKPDGLFLAAMLGGGTLWQLRQALAAAESEIEGGLSARVSPFADLRDAAGLLQRAGFAMPVADGETIDVEYENALALMRDLRAMGESNAIVERRRGLMRRTTLLRAAEIYGQRFGQPSGRVWQASRSCSCMAGRPTPHSPSRSGRALPGVVWPTPWAAWNSAPAKKWIGSSTIMATVNKLSFSDVAQRELPVFLRPYPRCSFTS